MAISGSVFTPLAPASTEAPSQPIASNIVFEGLTQDQVNAASASLGLPESTDPRRNARDILDLLTNSLKASGDSLTSYTASRAIEVVDNTSARETYTFTVDMQISLVNPVDEAITTPVVIPAISVPVAPIGA